MILAYSYIRWSNEDQSEGDSLRRQTVLRDTWLKRNPHVRLAETFTDEGVSGYSGAHVESGALSKFLGLVKRGRVPPGSYLLVENLDRLSRLGALPTAVLVSDLTKTLNVVTLNPERLYPVGNTDDMALLSAMLEGLRGHSESKRKSELIRAAFAAKRQAARETGSPHNCHVPFWLEKTADGYKIRPKAAAVVRRMFKLTLTKGVASVARQLTEEQALGRRWAVSSVHWVLHTKVALGEYRPHDGEPVAGYYPPAVTEQAWYAAQAATASRGRRSGRKPKTKQLFSGLLWCCHDSCSMHVATVGGRKCYASAKAKHNQGGRWCPFPVDVLERALLSRLRELRAADLFEDATDTAELQGRLATAEQALAVANEKWEADPLSHAWQAAVTKHDKRVRELAAELAEKRAEAANPLSATWADITDSDPERLRSVLLRAIERIECVTTKVGRTRMIAAQVHFTGSTQRRAYIVRNDGECWSEVADTARDFSATVGPLEKLLTKMAE